eukprot:3089307-Pleurochrysis_carterae.AAC.1
MRATSLRTLASPLNADSPCAVGILWPPTSRGTSSPAKWYTVAHHQGMRPLDPTVKLASAVSSSPSTAWLKPVAGGNAH